MRLDDPVSEVVKSRLPKWPWGWHEELLFVHRLTWLPFESRRELREFI